MGMRDYKSLTLSVLCFPPVFFALGVVWAVAPETTLWEQLHLFFVCLWLKPGIGSGCIPRPPVSLRQSCDWENIHFFFNAYRVSEGLTLAIQGSFIPKLIKNRTLPQEWLIWVCGLQAGCIWKEPIDCLFLFLFISFLGPVYMHTM